MTRPAHLNTVELRSILEKGIQAPSADNMQPWKFRIKGDVIDLYLDRTKGSHVVEALEEFLRVSAGAVLENIRVAAAQQGFRLLPSYLPDQHQPDLIATLRFETASDKVHPHASALDERATNRKFYAWGNKVHHSVFRKLEEVVAKEGFRLLWIRKGDAPYSKLVALIGDADQLRFESPGIHESLIETLRLNETAVQGTKDGLDAKTFELGPGGTLLFKLLGPWERLKVLNHFGMSLGFNLYTRLQLWSSQAIGLIVANDNRPIDYIHGGEIMERLWHEMTCEGLAIQPMMALPIFIRETILNDGTQFTRLQRAKLEVMKNEFFSLFNLREENALIFLFRIGYAKPPTSRSLRRPIESFLIP